MGEYLISVVVPIYRVEAYLEQCIRSLISQTLPGLEIILVDDGSPDGCPQICDRFAGEHRHIRVIHQPNGGILAARRAGVEAASGEYVTFVDGDDWVEPELYAQVAAIIDQAAPDIVSYGYSGVRDGCAPVPVRQRIPAGLYRRAELEASVFPVMLSQPPYFTFGVLPSLCCKVIRRPLLTQGLAAAPGEVRIGEDLAVSLPCMLRAESVFFCDLVGYGYRKNPSSVVHTYDPRTAERTALLLTHLSDQIAACAQPVLLPQLNDYALFMLEYCINTMMKSDSLSREALTPLRALTLHPCVCAGLKQAPHRKLRIFIRLIRGRHLLLLRCIRRRQQYIRKARKTQDQN
ncbi:MAG: glycosyltransferase family 2 protein [Candidatus Ventricola sp.]